MTALSWRIVAALLFAAAAIAFAVGRIWVGTIAALIVAAVVLATAPRSRQG